MKTILLTGSESFGEYMINPSKWLALYAHGHEIEGYRIHSLVLPSVVQLSSELEHAGERILNTARRIGASAILSFAQSSSVNGFQVEQTGVNWVYDLKNCLPEENDRPLDPTRPPHERLSVDMSYFNFEKMKRLFAEARVPFGQTISDDAGRYSCNSWIYRTLRAMQDQEVTMPYCFVHTACTKESIELVPGFDLSNKVIIEKEDTLTALEIIIKSLEISPSPACA